MLMMMLNMIIVTRRSRGDERSLATSTFRLSVSVLKAFTFIDERENKATSEEEKKAEQKRKMRRSKICPMSMPPPMYTEREVMYTNHLKTHLTPSSPMKG